MTTRRRAAPWYVYVARCADDTLYCGIARDVAARIAAHDAGRGARYTRGRGPLAVAYLEACRDKPAALRREHAIKQLSRAAKQALIARGARSGDTARDAKHSDRRPARLARGRRGAPAVRARGR